MRRTIAQGAVPWVTPLILLAACGPGLPEGSFVLPGAEAARYETAYLAVVVADPDGDDLMPGAGEHVVVRNRWTHRADLGGWWVEDADGNRLPLGIGRQLEPDAELRVYTSCGEGSEAAVYACLGHEMLDDDGDLLRLLDSSGDEAARFAYGTARD